MSGGERSGAEGTLPAMVPLHLHSTTVAVSEEHAKMLVSRGLAEWIPGGKGLVAKTRDDAPVLAAIAA